MQYKKNLNIVIFYLTCIGTAVIFSVVVTSRYDDGNGTIVDYSSVYATSGTYACRLGKSIENMNCQVMWYTITKAICGISVFAGAFLAIFGHRYYLMSQLLFGVYGKFCIIITYLYVYGVFIWKKNFSNRNRNVGFHNNCGHS